MDDSIPRLHAGASLKPTPPEGLSSAVNMHSPATRRGLIEALHLDKIRFGKGVAFPGYTPGPH